MVLLNVFHGATDGLKAGWIDDVVELKEMALWNMFFGNSTVVVGPKWKERFGIRKADSMSLVQRLVLPEYGLHETAEVGNESTEVVKFLDDSRKVPHGTTWCCVSEFLSNNLFDYLAGESEYKKAFEAMEWFDVVVDNKKEYQLLRLVENGSRDLSRSLWLLVAMNCRSSDIEFGLVEWTKVVAGQKSCLLRRAIANRSFEVLKDVLQEQVEVGTFQMNVTGLKKVEPNLKPDWNVLFSNRAQLASSPPKVEEVLQYDGMQYVGHASHVYGQVPVQPGGPQPFYPAQYPPHAHGPPVGGSVQLMNASTAQYGHMPLADTRRTSTVRRFRPSGRKRALLIGINYSRICKSEQRNYVIEVTGMANLLLTKFGFRNTDLFVMTDVPTKIASQNVQNELPTRTGILQVLRWLVESTDPGDSLFFHFSGLSGCMRADKNLYKAKFSLPMDHVSNGHILTVELYEIMVRNVNAGARVTAVLDCRWSSTLPCTYGSFYHGAWTYMEQGAELENSSFGSVLLFSICLDLSPSNPRFGLCLPRGGISGADTGAMTYCLTEAILNGSVGDWRHFTYGSLLDEMLEKLRAARIKEVPQFSISHPFDLSSPFII